MTAFDPDLDGPPQPPRRSPRPGWLSRRPRSAWPAHPLPALQFPRTFGTFPFVSRAKAPRSRHWIRRQTLANRSASSRPELKAREAKILQLRAAPPAVNTECSTRLRRWWAKQAARSGPVAPPGLRPSMRSPHWPRWRPRRLLLPPSSVMTAPVIEAGRPPVGGAAAGGPSLRRQATIPSRYAPAAPDLMVLPGPNAKWQRAAICARTGLLQLMAQIGSWIRPARRLGLCRTDLTRVGAVDDLARRPPSWWNGLKAPTPALTPPTRSLVLLDEIGRARAPSIGCSMRLGGGETPG